MTLEEAKETLAKKGYSLRKDTDFNPSQVVCFTDKVLKCAVATVNANGYMVFYGKPVNVETQEYIDKTNKSNDALLDEQAKKIKDLEKKNIILNEKVVTMSNDLSADRFTNKVIAKKNKKIASLKKSIKEKDEVIDTISEELRLSKEREEELIATVKDYLALVGDKDEEIKKLNKNNKIQERTSKFKDEIIKEKDRTIKILMKAFGNDVITCKGNPFKDSIEIIKAPF